MSVLWAFHPWIKSFKYCYPILTIDGVHHPVWQVEGHSNNDGNNKLLLLAFAFIEGENIDARHGFF